MAGPWEAYGGPAVPDGPWSAYRRPEASLSDAITDIPGEIGKAADEALTNIGGITKRGGQGPVEGLLTTGKAALGVPQLLLSPLTGAARSLLGHPIAEAETLVGGLINPKAAEERRTSGKAYEDAKQSVDTALAALATRGAAPAAASSVVRAPSEGQQVVDAARRLSDVVGDVNVPRAVASDNIAVQRVGQGIRNIPVVGDAIPKATFKLTDDLGGAVRSVADQYGAGSGPNVANRVGRTISDAAEAETAAARASAQRSDDALLADWQRNTDAAGRAIAAREEGALERARRSVGDMSPQDMGEALIARLRAGEQEARANKTQLYNEAGNSDAAVSADAVGSVRARVAQALENDARVIDGVLTPASARMMDELQRFASLNIENRAVGARMPTPSGEQPVRAAVSVQGIEQTRKRLTGLSRAATNDADRAAAGRIMREFDAWESDAFDNALFSGSPGALDTYRRARDANRDWRTRFGFNERDDADRIVNRIVTGEVTPQEVSNWLVGASQVGAKGQSSRLLTRIAEATGGDAEAMQAIRGGVWNRLSQATEGATARTPEKVASGINEFLNGSGRDVARRLFTPEQQGIMRAYADTIRAGQTARELVADVSRATKPQSMDVGIGPMQELANTVLGRGGKTDEALFSAIDAYAKSGGRGDVQTLSNIVRNLPPQDRGDLAGAIIRNLGVSPRTGAFSPDVFVSQWQTYTPQAKAILFGNAGPHRQALDDIALISNRLKQIGQRFGNPSGTAQNVNMLAAGAGVLAAPITTLAGVTGGAIAAKILAAPAGASSAAKWSRAYAMVTTKPSAQTIGAYQIASRNLANTANSLGSNVSAVDFLRSLQSPATSGAQEQNNVPRPPGQ
jgi:hypothetical protein